MWRFASKAIAGSVGPRNGSVKRSQTSPDSSDDEGSSSAGREEGLECPICFESFNIVENVPYVVEQQSAHNSLATVSDSCHHRPKPRMTSRNMVMDHSHLEPNHLSTTDNAERGQSFLRKSVFFFFRLTARFPFIIIFLLIALYAVPASAAILALYVLVTLLFGLPSFLILYFAYPSLDWLFKEIVT